jgi:hypothetical protein
MRDLPLALSAACGQEPTMRPAAPRVLTARDLHAVDVTLDGSGGAPSLRFVVAARMTADGARLVVLGPEPPFVHVLGRDGRPLAAFGSRGAGADGLEAPVALAVSDADEVLVADAAGPAVVFALDGSVRGRIADTGVLPMAAAAPCAGQWLVYGPRRGAAAGVETEWLHRLGGAPASAVAATRALADRAPSGTIGLGRPFGLVAGSGAAVLRHDEGAVPALVTWRCGSASPSVAPLEYGGRASDAGASAAPHAPGGIAVRVPPGARAPSGVAAVTGGVVLADMAPGQHPRTELTLLRGGARTRVEVGGAYVLRDSRPGVGVLLQTMDPAPRLFLVGEKELLSLFP